LSNDNPPLPARLAGDRDPDPTNVRGRRIGAVFIDFALLLIPSLLIASWSLEKRTDVTSCDQVEASIKSCITLGNDIYVATGGRIVAWQLLSALLGVVYYVILQGLTGSTIGKRLVGVRVVDAAGAVCGVPRAMVRYLPLLLPALIPVVGPALGGLIALAEFILILANRRHQRMGDLMAKTFVVRHEAVGQPVPAGET
jgi:uncharacterized RDD family membrane protein YckC